MAKKSYYVKNEKGQFYAITPAGTKIWVADLINAKSFYSKKTAGNIAASFDLKPIYI